jgi:NTP pyrophosphatase (non-canonical NTP hydrolase)
MSLDDIQKEVDKWTDRFDPPYWPALEQLARLAEETGEVARVISHMYGYKKARNEKDVRELGEELSDVMFTVICIANKHNINLQVEWDRMKKEKLYGRDKNRYKRS